MLFLPAVCFGLTGCGLTGGSSDRVIYANYDDSDGFCGQIKDAFAAKAQADGIEVEFLDAKNDGNMQIDQLNEAISGGAGAIILLAADGTSIVKTIEKANDAGIPIITVNRSVAGGKVLRAYSDDKEAGRMQGEYMAAHLPPNAKVVYLQGDGTQGSAVGRWEGFKEACLDKRPDVQLLSLVAAVGIYSNYMAKQSLDEMYHHNLMATQYLNDANDRLRRISVNVPYLLQEGFTADNRKILVDDVLGNLDGIRHDLEELKKIDTSERAQAMVAELEEMLHGLNNDTQDMSAVTEEMSAGMEETAASTSSVQHLSEGLSDGIRGASTAAADSEAYTREVAQRAADL
mgnify:CR=1 FL=1